MTKRELKVFESRLRRVWAPVGHIHTLAYKERWEFGAWITQEIALYVDVYPTSDEPKFEMRGPGHYSHAPGLRYDEEIDNRIVSCQEQEEFTNKWLPYFRRGIWLSGIPIEATAHEKAEWIQGFTYEEIESWNLKM